MVSAANARTRESAGNLPADVTSFVGRRHEITLTKRLFSESRVVTLTGPGGVGKTRLAIRVATSMRRSFRDKAWFVELENLDDGTLVLDSVIEQLGLGGPSSAAGLETIVDQLKNREMLLVLDNCEHVIEDVALLVDALMRWCPGVRVLATSRQSLGVAGESTVVVPPMQVPDPDHLPPPEAYEQFSSVRLFVDRAKAAVPEFEVTADNAEALMRLCHHLDGNPLAIELAAVRLRSLSLQQLEERLAERYDLLTEGRRGAPPRQQTLRALIDWSYELLEERDRRAWARMSVFSGSFDLTAAEHVVGEGKGVDVLTAVHSLVDKSVLMREEGGDEVRYRLPHTLRDYGLGKLGQYGETALVRHRHCAYFADLSARFAAEWIGPDQASWVKRLRLEQDNLRAALRHAAEGSETGGVALRLVTDLWQYWGIRGLNTEARHWLDEVLDNTSRDLPERVKAMRVSAWFALLQGDLDKALPTLERATVLATQRGDEVERAYLALLHGLVAFFQQDQERGAELAGGALERFRKHGELAGELWSLHALGLIKGVGDPDEGMRLLAECVQLSTEHGELYWRSYAQWAIAQVQMRRDRADRAENSVKEALRLQRQLDNRLGMAFSLDTLAWIAHRQQRFERAARLLGTSSALWDAVRSAPGFWARIAGDHDEHLMQIRTALGPEAFDDQYERGREMSLTHAVDYALELKGGPSKRSTTAESDDNVHPMPLTRRERQIADLVAQGRTNKDIAENLVIAQRTVEGHVQNILTKLDFTSRAQIAGWVAGQRSGDGADTSAL
ncbi:LuxR family transcriptional regulator [Saccharopolyspora rhizosphaerae]|uniref:LuxR family transcriptional regulator n=1 Tax=Saccharopolyspora rhizosphaerae TaxID=2492662 RepID=A0A426JSB2_9PSEU|nr:LuxR C-terminal-related transcriptional regulator [Saccharopolyspora rhizosphaerae]RRO16017.1 LuxR family transcriptional regulator [Saccharopolyspora rhizosphaerae]